jgi:site-specific DNA recombinase
MRIAILARVSSHHQEQEATVETQLSFARTWAALHDHEVHDFYVDEAVSGTVPVAQRPEGSRLLADARKGCFQAVAAYRLDRVGRSIRVVYDAIEALEGCGVDIISMTEPFDTTTHVGKLILGILTIFAEFEREAITQRCTDGRRRVVKDGGWGGGREPFGYRRHEKRLLPNEDTAPLVQRIFERFVEGEAGLHRLAFLFTQEGVPSPSAYRAERRGRSRKWHATTLHDMLTNPVYKGLNSWGGIEQAVPALVSEALWSAAQRKLSTNKQFQTRQNNYLLSGLVRCGLCGYRFQATNWKNGKKLPAGQFVYGCRHKIMGSAERGVGVPRCTAPYLDGDIDRQVLEDCRLFLSRPDVLRRLLAEQIQGEAGSIDLVRDQLHSLQAEKAAKREERARLITFHRKGHITDSECEVELGAIEAEEAELASRIAALQVRIGNVEARREHLDHVEGLLHALASGEMDDQQVARVLVQGVEVFANSDGSARAVVTYWPNEAALGDRGVLSLTKGSPHYTLPLLLAYPRHSNKHPLTSASIDSPLCDRLSLG